jgi:hypothetical protein
MHAAVETYVHTMHAPPAAEHPADAAAPHIVPRLLPCELRCDMTGWVGPRPLIKTCSQGRAALLRVVSSHSQQQRGSCAHALVLPTALCC